MNVKNYIASSLNNRLAVIEVSYGDKINILTYYNHKNKVSIDRYISDVTIDLLGKYIQQNTTVLLLINNEKVIIKNEETTLFDDSSIFHKQTNKLNEFSIVSGIRKDYLTSIITLLDNYRIIDVSIGLGDILTLKEINLINTEFISVGKHEIDTSNRTIKARDGNELIPLHINGNNLSNQSILLFAFAIENIVSSSNRLNLPIEIAQNKEDQKFKKWYYISGVSLLFAVLILVILINSYQKGLNNDINSQSVEIKLQKRKQANIKSLISDYEKKNELIKRLGISLSIDYTNTLNIIGKTTPKSVVINNISINKLNNGVLESNEDLIIDSKSIIIAGFTKNISSISDWSNTLKQELSLSQIKLNSFDSKEEKTNFSLTALLP